MSDARLKKLLEKRAQIQAQIKAATAKTKQQERKDDTRRKIILGAFALEHMEKNKSSPFTQTLYPLLDEYVTRQQDRELLNAHFDAIGLQTLPPLPDVANDASQQNRTLKRDFPKSSTA